MRLINPKLRKWARQFEQQLLSARRRKDLFPEEVGGRNPNAASASAWHRCGAACDTGALPDMDKLEVAEENLSRIRVYYTYYRAVEKLGGRHGKVTALCKSQPWYVPKYRMALFLVTDDGQQMQFSAPWCGYFEGLYGAEVTVVKERLPSFRM